MPGPREQERRSTQFDPQREEPPEITENKAESSKRIDGETGKQEDNTGERARRPRSGRSGSDSNASRRTRGH